MSNCNMPIIGSSIKVRSISGAEVDGVVTGHSEKDGKPIIDFLGSITLRSGQMSEPTPQWAWVDQIIQERKLGTISKSNVCVTIGAWA